MKIFNTPYSLSPPKIMMNVSIFNFLLSVVHMLKFKSFGDSSSPYIRIVIVLLLKEDPEYWETLKHNSSLLRNNCLYSVKNTFGIEGICSSKRRKSSSFFPLLLMYSWDVLLSFPTFMGSFKCRYVTSIRSKLCILAFIWNFFILNWLNQEKIYVLVYIFELFFIFEFIWITKLSTVWYF